MSTTPRRRYRVRLRRAVAGSFLAAAAAASVTGLAAAPALAFPPAVAAGVDSADSSDADSLDSSGYEARDLILGLRLGSSPNAASTVTANGATSSAERLAGVRADLDRAVLLRMVTPEQADKFYVQIERRVAAGL
ncbi:hypothetical protein ACX80I_12670 [Arthrobacter sp. MDT3-44]